MSRRSVVRWLVGVSGAAFLVGGLGLRAYFSPSPHGLLEAFVAGPLIVGGGLLLAISILLGGRKTAWYWRTLGWCLVLVSVGLLIALVTLVWFPDIG